MNTVYLNGRFVPLADARVSVDDRGFLYGDGVFETMRSRGGRVVALDRHMRRLFAACERLAIRVPESPREMGDAIMRTVAENGGGDLYVRLTVTRGEHDGAPGFACDAEPTRVIRCRKLIVPPPEVYESGVPAVTMRINPRHGAPAAALKSVSFIDYVIAKECARQAGAFETILVDADGFVVEGASSNVFVVRNERVSTPPDSRGLLPGVTRSLVRDAAASLDIPYVEEDVPEAALASADEVFLTNSIVGLIHVAYLIDPNVPKNAPPDVSRRLRAAIGKFDG
ncbi:aminotransferase class IV [bacterium]|nr:aminotransferase class IV [bacterium]